jgi:hypothetical protein
MNNANNIALFVLLVLILTLTTIFSGNDISTAQTTPDTTIISATDGNGNNLLGGGTTQSTSITITFTGTGNVAGFQCRLDSLGFIPCRSPVSYNSLSNTVHFFDVQAIDTAGNVDPVPAHLSWTVSTSASGGIPTPYPYQYPATTTSFPGSAPFQLQSSFPFLPPSQTTFPPSLFPQY